MRDAGTFNHGLKRIEIDHHQVDSVNAMRLHDFSVKVATRKDAAMDFRMQGLDATFHQLGKACVVRDFTRRHAEARDGFAGAARRKNFDASGVQPTRQAF